MTAPFQTLLLETLEKSCRHYLKHGLSHLLNEPQTEDDLLQAILNMQAAVEALAKLYQVNNKGWRAVVKPQFHSLSEQKLLTQLREGTLKMNAYRQAKDYVVDKMGLEKSDVDLLTRQQDCRNAIVHLGLPALPPTIRQDILHLTVRLVNTLAWNNLKAPHGRYLENHASNLLGNRLFRKLLTDPTYRAEAVRVAEQRCADSVWRCPECRAKAWADMNHESAVDDEMVCVACGYTVLPEMARFADCPLCHARNALFYDACNCGDNNPVGALCTECTANSTVIECKLCGRVSLEMPDWECECAALDR